MANFKVVCLVLVISMMVVGAPMAKAAITCGQVTSSVVSCIGYLRGGPGPTAPCCGGVRALNAAASSTADRQTACNCLKTTANAIPGINYDLAGQLPGKCGVNIPYKISPTTNCANIKF